MRYYTDTRGNFWPQPDDEKPYTVTLDGVALTVTEVDEAAYDKATKAQAQEHEPTQEELELSAAVASVSEKYAAGEKLTDEELMFVINPGLARARAKTKRASTR